MKKSKSYGIVLVNKIGYYFPGSLSVTYYTNGNVGIINLNHFQNADNAGKRIGQLLVQ